MANRQSGASSGTSTNSHLPFATIHHSDSESAQPVVLQLGSEERITRGNLPGLELLHDRFVRLLRPVIQREISALATAACGAIQSEPAHRFLKGLSIPSNLHLARLRPLPGTAIIHFSEQLIDALVESAFGGGASTKKRVRAVKPSRIRGASGCSSIEERIVGKFAITLLDVLRDSWASAVSLDPVYMSMERSPLALTHLAPSDVVTILPLTIRVEEQESMMEIVIPSMSLEPIKGMLGRAHTQKRETPAPQPDARVRDALVRSTVELAATLATGKIKVRDFLKLTVGDTVILDTSPTAPATISIAGTPKLQGTAGVRGGRHAIELSPRPETALPSPRTDSPGRTGATQQRAPKPRKAPADKSS